MADERAVLQVRREIAKRVQGQDEVDTPQLTRALVDWLAANESLQVAFLEESLYGLVQEVAGAVFKGKRRRPIILGGTVTTVDRIDRRAKENAALLRFQEWYESTGAGRKALLKMTRVDLDDAIKERSAQTATDVASLAFLREVRGRLQTDDETVGSRLKATDLARIEQRYFARRDHLLNEALDTVWHAAIKAQQKRGGGVEPQAAG